MMKDTPKPIKRSEQLTPLSREHHDGLLFVWKLRKGLSNGTDLKIVAAYIQWFWEHHLKPHFRAEEEILAPLLPAGHAMVERMLEEHQQIEASIHINESIPDAALIESLATQVNDHIRFEERQLFGEAERLLGKDGLDKVFTALEKEEKSCGEFRDQFWS
jgi:hemerythrin-like domain-containing protein